MAGIYIHVPFCTQRCIYCDFYSQTDMARQAAYLRAVRRELEMRADELDGEPVETIYFGGGTPSQLCGEDLGAIEAVRRLQDAGVKDISIDLIYGLPGQTPEAWVRNLDVAFGLSVTHLSAYHLTYEAGTRLGRMLRQGDVCPVDEDTSVRLYSLLTERAAAAGFVHYEVSNFCRPGWFARHNTAYWTGAKYLGIGPAAHSYDGQSRRWNVASLGRYIEGMEAHQPQHEREVLDGDMRYNEYIMTRLRTMWGVRLSVIREAWGECRVAHFLRQAAPFLAAGRLVRLSDNDTVRLTEAAFFVSDGIISELFV